MVCILLLALLQAAPAQPQAPKKWPIESITVTGNHNYSKEQILAVAGLKVGETAGREEFEAAQKRLEATGVFETVSYKFAASPTSSGYAATLQVLEAEPMYPVRYADLGIPDAEVAAWLKRRFPLSGPKLPATQAILDRYTKAIQELLAERQHPEKVVARLNPVGNDQFMITFRPNRLEAAVAEVTFEGNQVVPTNLLQEAVAGVAIGTPYSDEAFRELLNNAARRLYEARGRIRVSFPKLTTEKAHDVEGLVVHVTVAEGPSFELGEVALDNKSPIKTADLLKLANLKKGDLANIDEVNQGVERMQKRLRHDGYLRAATSVDRNIHDEKKTVDLTVHIDPGPQFLFDKLAIQGLDLEGEAAMRKLWGLAPGKPFNPEYPDYFVAQVKERGLFDNLGDTKAGVDVNEEKHTVNVTLSFHGSATTLGVKRPGEQRNPGP